MAERRGTKGLELWCRKMTEGYPGVKVENMTTSWRDGLAFCAIIHHFRPDLIEFHKLIKEDIYGNNELAFRVAEQYLGIPALLEPEDMVEYEVPDRLSILTYLSQFYQTFESQRGKTAARIAPKRPQSTTDHGIVSPASTSPPTKIQVTIGKSRREPCAKCNLPVFIAERLNVGKHLYHRTCFKCARCNTQLTLANYYETETGEFCCEVCPDEESQNIGVLSRSLSDEEKTESLKAFAERPDPYVAQFEQALEFTRDRELTKDSTLSRTERSRFFNSQMEEEAGGPELPKSKPPVLTITRESTPDLTEVKLRSLSSRVQSDTKSLPITTTQEAESPLAATTREASSGLSDIKPKLPTTKPPSLSNPPMMPTPKLSRTELFREASPNLSEINTRKASPELSDTSPDLPTSKPPLLSSSREASPKLSDIRTTPKLPEPSPKPPETDSSESTTREAFPEVATAIKPAPELSTAKKASAEEVVIESSPELSDRESAPLKSAQTVPRIRSPISISTSFLNVASETPQTVVTSERTEHSEPLQDTSSDFSVSEQKDVVTKDAASFSVRDRMKLFESASESKKAAVVAIDDLEDFDHIGGKPEVDLTKDDSAEPVIIIDDSDTSKPDISHITISDVNSSNVLSEESFLTADSLLSPDPATESPLEGDTFKRGYHTAYQYQDSTAESVPEVTAESVLSPDPAIESPIEGETFKRGYYTAYQYQDSPAESVLEVTTGQDSSALDESIPEVAASELQDSPAVDESSAELNTIPEKALNPFGDTDEGADLPSTSPSKPLATVDVSPKPTPEPRRKLKVISALSVKNVVDTPEYVRTKAIQRTSINPFEDSEPKSSNPFEDSDEEVHIPKKRIVPEKSYNPFEDDDDEQEEEVKPVPVPRLSKSSRPEPRPRDTLSVTSRGSHGGSNSSLSSNSAFGSARKKRPAPRPPIPFSTVESPTSNCGSPSSSVAHSPQTLRSRKTKRAPLPSASTPSNYNSKPADFQESPINLDGGFKEKKDEENRLKQYLADDALTDKSSAGRWKRRKGLAPQRPVPQKRTVKALPLSEIKRELNTIEIQQQGLEKQGVRLEQIIRDKCEIPGGPEEVPIEVEDLILQLFELVNEKNELFRRQTELMYLKRQQRLEEEQADLEYQVRCLMLQPGGKSDSDKLREEMLIKRLVETVDRRNEIIERLEMDRKREVEEDQEISSHLNLYSAKREEEKSFKEEDKKDKKKKHKKLNKIIHAFKHKKEKDQKAVADKDIDETEVASQEKEKKKRLHLF